MEDEKQFVRLIYNFYYSSFIGVAVGSLRGIIQKSDEGMRAIIRGVLASFLVAVFVGIGLEDFNFSFTLKIVIIGVSALIADDILLGLMSIGRALGRDPFGFFARVLSAYKGQISEELTAKTPVKRKRKDDNA